MKHRIAHDLTPDLCQRATRAALDAYKTSFPQFSPGVNWTSDDRAEVCFVTPVGRIEGAVTVEASAVLLSLDKLPWAARPFRRQAVRIIEDEVKAWIQKAKDGELSD